MAAAPGWYPDPDGKGGQRYFDGTNWGPQAPAATAPPPPPPPQKKPGGCLKTVLGLVGIIFVIGIIGNACGSDDDKSSSSSSSSSSNRSSEASATSTTPAGPKKPDATFVVAPGGAVTASFAIGDNFTKGLIKDGARFETIDILKYAKLTYPSAPQVEVKGSFPMKDAYGNTSTDTVIDLVYLKSTIDQINFDGVDKDKIWEIRDSGIVVPAFRP